MSVQRSRRRFQRSRIAREVLECVLVAVDMQHAHLPDAGFVLTGRSARLELPERLVSDDFPDR